jgi:uncharacterized spore protein YtfJ
MLDDGTEGTAMEIHELLAKANDSIQVGRVFGTPIECDGALVIPVAAVAGGSGGGGGTGVGPGGEGEGSGSGGGFGVIARPVGVYVIRDSDVRWVPVIDSLRVLRAGVIVAVAALTVAGSTAWAQAFTRAARAAAHRG